MYEPLSAVPSGLTELQNLLLDSASMTPSSRRGSLGLLVQHFFFGMMRAGSETGIP